ncbi:histidinol phosphatase-like enzyme [Rhizobium sp. BK650]|uniref:hypothetical protein n=1 Tax=Rhizobium sp. BK650 TaxID=2586990 RepID=UPI0016093D73|nr:hypothetical protein [Rhizobium sp. BK650]MBB3659715.1 histidinol phosphatase-like enzyme [Rhizobium sp. BK650]
MTDELDLFCIFRKIGSAGFVVLERDDILLKRENPARDLTLGDINDELVEMLKQLREQDVGFGFISHQTGMTAGSDGWLEYAALTRMLDELLRVRGASPDFWMACHCPSHDGTEFAHRNDPRAKTNIEMLLRATAWYGADKSRTVFVSSSPARILDALDADITSIQYRGWRTDPTVSRPRDISGLSYLADIPDVQSLRTAIERSLGLVLRRTG